ncbi:hypothetical protein CYY_008485 [Polysphondylium violaceum]|uniref:Homeobox domain-containing protein n=1 Tax=Polysphondylium violaceum TaxID=133409 RepID=A0A8J4PLJ5_9MYCE|nr:hypothetical protein CYY_008485 [Polysphondylium violaceum]
MQSDNNIYIFNNTNDFVEKDYSNNSNNNNLFEYHLLQQQPVLQYDHIINNNYNLIDNEYTFNNNNNSNIYDDLSQVPIDNFNSNEFDCLSNHSNSNNMNNPSDCNFSHTINVGIDQIYNDQYVNNSINNNSNNQYQQIISSSSSEIDYDNDQEILQEQYQQPQQQQQDIEDEVYNNDNEESKTKIEKLIELFYSQPQNQLVFSFLNHLSTENKDKIKIFPVIAPVSKFAKVGIDFNFKSYLESQKLDRIDSVYFVKPVAYLNKHYDQEIENLDKEYQFRIQTIRRLSEQQKLVRPVVQDVEPRLEQIESIFKIIKSYQKTYTANVVLQVLKKYANEFKSRRVLDSTQGDSMNSWFYHNSSCPYPSEDEKVILGASNNLSKSQIDNWFGNKRMRDKNKRDRPSFEDDS